LPVRPHAVVTLLALAAALALAACGGEDDGGAELKVAATTGVAADIVSRIAAEDAEVVQIVPDGSNPHSYSPSASEQQELASSDLLVLFDPALEQALPLDVAGNRFAIAEHVGEPHERGDNAQEGGRHGPEGAGYGEERGDDAAASGEGEHDHAHSPGSDDPHVWLDPLAIEAALPELADALAEADPENAEAYRERSREYAAELERLDEELAAMVAQVPQSNRKLVTSHELIGYFAERYGFDVVGAPFGTNPEAEASAGSVAELIDRVQTERVPAVFAQQGDNPELLRMIADEAGVEVVDDLLVESLGEQAGSYVEMMRYSTRRITDALSG
jgi:zinc/manganese transport system substrate-binding protein